jgi:S1-C subfamily serine protease
MSLMEELSSSARLVAESVGPATVTVGRDGRGSGFVVAPGHILTNAHHMRDRTTQITFADGSASQATVHGSDMDGDLVVLAVDTGSLTPLTWSTEAPSAGDAVFAVSRGRHGLRTTFGMVSAAGRTFRGPRGRAVTDAVEHTAPLGRGATGGPLVDPTGKVVAITTARVGDGFAYARSMTAELRARISELLEGKHIERKRLGVTIAPADVAARMRRNVGLPEHDGVLLTGVHEDSVASRAGLKQGDLIVAVGDVPVTTADQLAAALDHVDDTATLHIVRGVEPLTIDVTFTPEPPTNAS